MRFLLIAFVLFIYSCQTNDQRKPGKEDKETDSLFDNTDSLIRGERIDGPANVRDTINGKIIFSLNNYAVVSATRPDNNWLQVGVYIDMTRDELKHGVKKGKVLYSNGKAIGKMMTDMKVGGFETNEGIKGELVGYTAASNIRHYSVPENSLSVILNHKKDSLNLDHFRKFIKDFNLERRDDLVPGLKGFEMDENWIDDPSPLLRLWLLFKGDQLVGLFHSRPLSIKTLKAIKVNRGFYFTSFTKDAALQKKMISRFNVFINGVD